MHRVDTPAAIEVDILIASRRRCALCFGLKDDFRQKKGQLAHINRKRNDNRAQNLCYLCLPHHDEYDTKPSQSKRFKPEELIHYREELLEAIKNRPALAWTDEIEAPSKLKRYGPRRDAVQMYSRRIRVYRAATELLAEIVRSAVARQETLWKYSRETDEALFLFDDEIAAYLFKLYQEAVRLEYVRKATVNTPVGVEPSKKAQEQYDLLVWFSDQFQYLRKKLIPFLRP